MGGGIALRSPVRKIDGVGDRSCLPVRLGDGVPHCGRLPVRTLAQRRGLIWTHRNRQFATVVLTPFHFRLSDFATSRRAGVTLIRNWPAAAFGVELCIALARTDDCSWFGCGCFLGDDVGRFGQKRRGEHPRSWNEHGVRSGIHCLGHQLHSKAADARTAPAEGA